MYTLVKANGKVLVKESLAQSGIELTYENLVKIRKWLKARKIPIHRMVFSCKLKVDKEDHARFPAVYAIRCKGSGKLYIGQSVKPHLRKLVHYFWLKNVNTPSSSNVFFYSQHVRDDIDQYGVDNFEMIVLKSFPMGTTEVELIKAEADFIRKHKNKLYNTSVVGKSFPPDMRPLFIEHEKLRNTQGITPKENALIRKQATSLKKQIKAELDARFPGRR